MIKTLLLNGSPHVFNDIAPFEYLGRALNRVCLLCGLRGSAEPDAETLEAEGHPDKIEQCFRAHIPRPRLVVVTEWRPYMGSTAGGTQYLQARGEHLTAGIDTGALPQWGGVSIYTKPGAATGPILYLTPDEFIDPNDFTDAIYPTDPIHEPAAVHQATEAHAEAGIF